jgi:phosphohistidine phosphatase
MQLYLLRHGIADDPKPGRPDSERALTDEGRAKLRRVLKRARSADVNPSLIVSSPYRRAVETAEVAVEVLRYAGEIEKSRAFVPETQPREAWEEIRLHSSEDSVLITSHEPLLSSLTAYVLGAPSVQVDMKKAALVRIDLDRFGAEPRGVLKWMLTPGLCLE